MACSSEAADFAFGSFLKGKKEVVFVPNGIDTQRFRLVLEQRQKVRADLGLKDHFVIGNVGRMCPQKNQSFLLEVFAHVVQAYPNSRLLLVGEGEERDHLKAQMEQRKLGEYVIFCGVSSQVETLLWAMDLFVLPSRFEGLPVSVVEAQAAGVPVLCSDAVSKRAKVTDLVQFLSLQAGANVWAEKILAMREEIQGDGGRLEKRSDRADQVRAAGFDKSAVVRQMEQIYEEGNPTDAAT